MDDRENIGIELVGEIDARTGSFVTVTDAQNTSLPWLVVELANTFRVAMTEIFRHPPQSRTTRSEVSTGKW